MSSTTGPQSTAPIDSNPPATPPQVKVDRGEGSFQIPTLDGIRTVAFTIVFFSHAGMGKLIPGGFGVTIFFFLSGYLITSLLRREFQKTGKIHLGHFFLRRVLRIFPPMYLTLALAVGAWAMGWTSGSVSVPGVLSRVFQVTNYYDVFFRDYGDMLSGTNVFWSLAVEEHFYLTFPFLFLLAAPRMTLRQFAMLLTGLCVLVLAWRCVIVYQWDDLARDRCYFCSDTRFDSIAFGCIMAVFSNPYMDPVWLRGTINKLALLILGFLILLPTFIIRDHAFRETFRYTVQGIGLFPIFYVVISNPTWPIFAWLEWAPVRFLGTLSYTLYLSHLLILFHFGTIWPHQLLWIGAVSFVLSFAYACAMYYAVELPCAKLRRKLHSAISKPKVVAG